MIPSMYSNPFVECTARDMEYNDVFTYWCQPYDYYDNLDGQALFTHSTPIIIEGARGSGKTMLLKHLSYFCQKSEMLGSKKDGLICEFSRKGSLGIYYRFKNDFGKLLSALNCDLSTKNEIFEEYFHLYFARELVLVLNDLLCLDSSCNASFADILQDLNVIFSTKLLSFADVILHINQRIEKIDQLIRRLKYVGNLKEELKLVMTGEQYIALIFKSIRSNIKEWKSLKLLVLIDEYENISAFQQTINTYIKQTDFTSGITYRIGMRPEGMVTYSTNIGSEHLQINRDYLAMQLRITDAKKFQRFLRIVAQKRLEKSDFFANNNLLSIEQILGVREDWVAEAVDAVKNRPHIAFQGLVVSEEESYTYDQVIEMLSCPDNPLLEVLNVLWINRGKSVDETYHAMNAYLTTKNRRILKNQDTLGYKYYLDYEMKYKYALLFALLAKCNLRKKYYSFTTFSYLSSGSINDFLSLCRNTIMALDEKGYNSLLAGNPIPCEIQDKGARDSASEQLDKIRLCEDSGTAMHTFVMNMGELFNHYHRDQAIQYPETNQFAFENHSEIMSRQLLRRELGYMIKWGVIEKKHNTQRISIGRRRGDLYHLNRLLSPIFGISYRTRGGYNVVLKTDVFEELLSTSLDASKILTLNKKNGLSGKSAATKAATLYGQMTLFGGGTNE